MTIQKSRETDPQHVTGPLQSSEFADVTKGRTSKEVPEPRRLLSQQWKLGPGEEDEEDVLLVEIPCSFPYVQELKAKQLKMKTDLITQGWEHRKRQSSDAKKMEESGFGLLIRTKIVI